MAAESPKSESPSSETAEDACASIRRELNRLAQAERDEAFALNLGAPPGSSTAMIETRLAAVLDRTRRLRETIREVRRRNTGHDPRIEQCTKMGSQAVVEAQKLTSSVEELLHARETAGSGGTLKSDEAPAASGATP